MPSADPSGCARLRSPGDAAGAWPPQCRQLCRHVAAGCGVGPPPCRRTARIPGTWRAGPPRPCAVVASSEVSLRQLLKHRLLQFSFGQKLLEACVLLLQLGEPLGFLGLHPALLLLTAVIGRLGDLDDATDIGNSLP
jgi:hypothetical protein